MVRALLTAAATLAILPAQDPVGPDLWSLRPLGIAAPPSAERIDAHVDAALAERSLVRAEPADRRTLLRRASRTLTGLPPTPEAVAAFAADERPDAFARVVDELLASRACAEHLARRWLDLARYSDSNGLDENLAFGEAWRYRDWVVRAFHEDMPFDRFGTLQIAGDLLPEEDPTPYADRVVATGFLALGPRMLAEQDKEKLVLDTVDEQVDLVGRTFLGLTLGCARCHDHKFDPVPTSDYYALAGIFKSTRSFAELGHVSKWLERPLEPPAETKAREAAIASKKAAEAALHAFEASMARPLEDAIEARVAELLLAGFELGRTGLVREAEDATSTSLRRDDSNWGSRDCVVLHTGRSGEQFAEYAIDLPAGDYLLFVRYAAAEARPLRVLVDGEERAERIAARTTGGWKPEHQRWDGGVPIALKKGDRRLRLVARGSSVPHLDRLVLQPAANPAAAGLAAGLVRNAAFLVHTQDGPVADSFRVVNDDAARRAVADEWQRALRSDRAPEAQKALLEGPSGLGAAEALAGGDAFALLPEDRRRRHEALRAAVAATTAAVPEAPPSALAVADAEPVDLPIHLRGNHLTLAAEKVPRGALTCTHDSLPPVAIAAGSGRLELARWMFSARNPLTARVAANRVWQFAFGDGLCRSESNFGARGDVPVHAALLDELAAGFARDGWSTRRLLRSIVLSATWQQRAVGSEHALQLDPDQRLHWRWPRPRVSAESLRDGVLAVSGTLDPTPGGSLLGVGNRGYVTNDQSGDAGRYDAPRRSLYLPVVRNAMYDLFTVFDYADPSVHLEERPQSTVALQALWFLNSSFAIQQSRALAEAAARAREDDEARTTWIWQRVLQRDPTAAERAAAARWLEQAPSDQRWPGLCQTLFASSEFVFVD